MRRLFHKVIAPSCRQQAAATKMVRLLHSMDRFFHARTNDDHVALAIAGIMRIAYAVLVLYDRFLLTLDFDFFFLSSAMPLSVSSRAYITTTTTSTSLLWLATEHSIFYWSVHASTVVLAALLLLGVLPRLSLVGLLITMSAFWTHNDRIWDSQDNIFRLWAIYLLFLPIQERYTIWDRFGRTSSSSSSSRTAWPMWPYRIWQFQLMAIYASAGLAKLAVPEWQNGSAMLHVIHTTDFYGGVFHPDLIFNRMGPLMVLTYASLLLECGCLITAWTWPTATVVAMWGLHLGIELAMNMHCLEWLCMIGWLTFLVRPEREDRKMVEEEAFDVDRTDHHEKESTPVVAAHAQQLDDEPGDDHNNVSMETVDAAAPPDDEPSSVSGCCVDTPPPTTSSKNIKSVSSIPVVHWSKPLLRHVGTCVLIAFGLAIGLETAPLERFYGLLPTTAHSYLQHAVDQQHYLVQTYTQPVTGPLRIRQGGWYMYSIPPMESYRYEIVLRHQNGTISSWHSPEWDDMTWYEKKRWQRHMSLYDRLGSATVAEWEALTRYMAQQQRRQHGQDTVASLELYQHKNLPVTWPVDLEFGFFKEARQPLARYQTTLLFSLNLCADFDEHCAAWASDGYCDWPISTYMSLCRYSCGYCRQDICDLNVGSRVAITYPVDYQFFRATVRQIKPHARRQVLLEYDVYDTDNDRYEWFDQHLLWERGLMILREEAPNNVDNVVPTFTGGREEL